jgi:hypothetical protein
MASIGQEKPHQLNGDPGTVIPLLFWTTGYGLLVVKQRLINRLETIFGPPLTVSLGMKSSLQPIGGILVELPMPPLLSIIDYGSWVDLIMELP